MGIKIICQLFCGIKFNMNTIIAIAHRAFNTHVMGQLAYIGPEANTLYQTANVNMMGLHDVVMVKCLMEITGRQKPKFLILTSRTNH